MTTPMHMAESNSDDNSEFSDEESPKKRRDLLTRRPSYRKILNDLGGGEIAGTYRCTTFYIVFSDIIFEFDTF